MTRSRAVFARPGFVLVFAIFAVGCSGGGGGAAANVPPPASHGQLQQIAAAPADIPGGADPQQDTGTLLPLSELTARTSSGLTTMSVSTCSSTAACTGGTNGSTGPGVAGVSSLGKGVTGTTTFASTTSSNGQFGIYGQDSSTTGAFDVGVYGLSVRGVGVSGKSTSNYGVRGTSTNSTGVAGTGGSRGVFGTGPTGVFGYGSSRGVYGTVSTSSAIGVSGSSPSYIAVYGTGLYGTYGVGTSYGALGTTSGGTGGYFSSSTYHGVTATSSSGTGMYATSGTGYAIEGHAGGSVGAYVTNSNGNGADVTGTYIGLVARGPSSGFPLVVTDSSGNNLFYVTGTGDVYYHGGIHTFAVTSSGTQALAYSTQTTRPNIQDTGTAQLANGRAVVTLDTTFARTIDRDRPYQVFLTPGGDTRGLYVSSKSPAQFVVREVQGGHGSFTFDYQITAVAAGKAAERMTIVRPNASVLRPAVRESPPGVRPEQ